MIFLPTFEFSNIFNQVHDGLPTGAVSKTLPQGVVAVTITLAGGHILETVKQLIPTIELGVLLLTRLVIPAPRSQVAVQPPPE